MRYFYHHNSTEMNLYRELMYLVAKFAKSACSTDGKLITKTFLNHYKSPIATECIKWYATLDLRTDAGSLAVAVV